MYLFAMKERDYRLNSHNCKPLLSGPRQLLNSKYGEEKSSVLRQVELLIPWQFPRDLGIEHGECGVWGGGRNLARI